MRYILTIIIMMFCIYAPISSYAFQVRTEDSLSAIKERIKAYNKFVKAKKLKQVKRIKTADSLVVYGADKNEKHILFVHNSNYAQGLYVQYIYSETEVFGISVLKRPVKSGENNKRSFYYFENRKLIFSKNRNEADDIRFLLSEAERYREEGILILRSLRANPIPKI